MSILKVARMGHPVLRQPTSDLSAAQILDPKVQALVDDMIETMREYEGVGLAAPQVHHSLRLLVAELRGDADQGRHAAPVIPLTALFNVRLEHVGKERDHDWEGCLSIPGIRGMVPRHRTVGVSALDRFAKPVQFKATGFFARVLQHETDHLDGILFPERMDDLKQLAFIEEYYRFQEPSTA